ncbi:putative glycosyl transferase, family 1, chitobiosyldiphosphodolichol beta-mannosyltransferase ALG1 [Plasmopara halstedii]
MRCHRSRKKPNAFRVRHVIVMVLGDIGRSPRMQYHALSLARMTPSIRVTLLGYAGESCVPDVANQSNIKVLTFTPLLQRLPRQLFLLFAPIKVLLQLLQLLWLLLITTGSMDLVLLQNPPTIPTFVVVWLCCRIKNAKFVIDWHNLGYSLLALAIGSTHPVVQIAKWIERVFGRKADANFCVTRVMQTWLQETWQIQATVLHDKPPLFFKPTPIEIQHELLVRVGNQLEHCNDLVTWGENQVNLEETLLTRKFRIHDGKQSKTVVQARENRPAMIISSTSWTVDEDFGILLAALDILDTRTSSLSVSEFPNLLVVVTGKGPQKDMYLEKIRKLSFKRIRIATMWLEASDYPLVLGSADVGVCLHTSSSGLDLPMKVLDMFGCGLPVCAIKFQCLDELVKHDKNGLVFDSAKELSAQLYDLLKGYPKNTAQLNRLRSSLKTVEHWPENWSRVAAPVFKKQLKLS